MENNKLTKTPWWREGVLIFVKVSAYIAVPVIFGLYTGKYLDEKFNTYPYLFIVSISVSFILTMYLIWNELKIYKKKIEKEENLTK